MKFRYALLALALACNGDDGDKTGVTGDTADTDTDTDTDPCAGGEFTGAVAITSASLTCTGTTATLHVATDGVAAGGSVYFQETGNVGTGQWSENHSLSQTAADECGFTSELGSTVTTGVDINAVDDTNSLFSCDQLEDNDYMTFAFFALDGTDAVVDCVAFGDDVTGLLAGTHDNVGDDSLYDLAGCTEGTEGM